MDSPGCEPTHTRNYKTFSSVANESFLRVQPPPTYTTPGRPAAFIVSDCYYIILIKQNIIRFIYNNI